jgi:hypothetical protein
LATVLKVNYKAKKIDLAIECDDVRDQGVDVSFSSLLVHRYEKVCCVFFLRLCKESK